MQSSYRGWCDRGVVRIGPSYALPSPAGLRPLLCQLPNPSSLTKEYDDEDSDYEYINSLPVQRSQRYTFPPSFFNSIVQRAKSLRATVGENASFYVTYKTLSQPMPSLWRLSLSKFPRSIPPPGFPTTPQPVLNEGDREYSTKPITWFGGITPNLRELDFAYIHAPWSDPIYSKLTYLRIYKPEIKLKLSQLLRILRACPSIEYLDLTECFIRPQSPQQTLVDDASKSLFRLDLPNLWYLHLQESIPASSPYLLAYITCPRLETLVLCSVDPSFIAGNVVAVDCGDFDYYSAQGSFKHAFEPLAHLLSRTTELHFTHSSVGQISVIGRTGDDGIPHIARWTHHDSTIKRVPGSGWSFSYAIGAIIVCLYFFRLLTLRFPAPQRPRPSPQLLQSQAARLRQMLQHQMELLQQLDVAGVHYHLIEKIDLGGNALYIDEFCEGLLSQCINLKRLRLRAVPLGLVGVSPPYASPDTRPFLSFSAMNILSIVIADRLNPQLEEVHVSWFAASASALADWVEMRAFKIKRLKKVVVDVYELVAQMMHSQPFALDDMGEESSKLDEESKMRIEAALEKREDYSEPLFIWRNPESERMMGAHAYYKETFGLNDHNLETNIETGS
ncbi:hypothetical protein FRC17_010083 [Serendipita sp. 399]|nr:hypothetical protein FRC17_010083 [Serendipita sp. 399]